MSLRDLLPQRGQDLLDPGERVGERPRLKRPMNAGQQLADTLGLDYDDWQADAAAVEASVRAGWILEDDDG